MQVFSPQQEALLGAVAAAAQAASVDVYIVGGVVRDLLRGHIVGEKDFDFMVAGDAASFAERCCDFTGGAVKAFPDFLTAKIVAPVKITGLAEIDFASSRAETYPHPGALPVVTQGDLSADLARRDFTVNALALPLVTCCEWLRAGSGEAADLRAGTIDHHGGLIDLDDRIVRVLHPASFGDDPTRIFRGCRYVMRLGGAFSKETETALDAALRGGAMNTVSGFRIVTELKKMSAERDFSGAFVLLERYGVRDALGLSGAGLSESWASLLERVDLMGVPRGRRFEVVLRVLFAAAGSRAGESFSRLGFGKKQMRHLEVDCAAGAEDLSSNHVTPAGVWFALVRGVGEPDVVRRILRERGEDAANRC